MLKTLVYLCSAIFLLSCGGQSEVPKNSNTSSSSSSSSSSSTSSSSSSGVASQKSGAELYGDLCANCHNADGSKDLHIEDKSWNEIYNTVFITMPKADPSECDQLCSAKVTDHITQTLFPSNEPVVDIGKGALRLITRDQLSNVITDTFAPAKIDTVAIYDRVGRPLAHAGYENNASAGAVVGDALVESMLELSEIISEQVVDQLPSIISCNQGQACAESFINKFATRAFRRDLSAAENTDLINLFSAGNNFNDGIKLVTQGIIASPNTLYQVENNQNQQKQRLSGEELASRISFFIWNSIPDKLLLNDVERLDDPTVLRQHVERMLADDRAQAGIHAFVRQWLDVHEAEERGLLLNEAVAEDSSAGIGRFFDYLLRVEDGTFSDLFMDRRAFVTDEMATIYGIDIPANAMQYQGSSLVTLPADERAGLITRIGFTSQHAHDGFTSPTLRGQAVRERILCQEIALPPTSEDAANFDIAAAAGKTGREFVQAHYDAGKICANCHLYLDELGLTFENYEPDGRYRTQADDAPIDASGQYYSLSPEDSGDERLLNGAIDLSRLLSESSLATECFAENWMRYALMRELDNDQPSVIEVKNRFKQSGFKLHELMLAIIESSAFQYQGPDLSALSLPDNQ